MLVFILGVLAALAAVWAYNRMAGFASQKTSEYEGIVPTFDLRKHLNGKMTCDGMIFGPTGRVTSRFRAEMEMTWDGDRGVMDELFHYDDGTTQTRAWHLTLGADGTVEAKAADVIGTGGGRLCGNTLGLRYTIKLPVESGGHVLDAVDWMYLQPDGTILNRSQFRKFGLKVAELFCIIRPEEKPDA